MRSVFDTQPPDPVLPGPLLRVRGPVPRRRLREGLLSDAISKATRRVDSGETVAVGVPSRGIDRLVEMVGRLVEAITARGAEAVLVPAMGSHGGNTSAGRRAQLEGQGLGAPRFCVEDGGPLEKVGPGPVYLPRMVRGVHRLILINRIKQHTIFRGPVQSGLGKGLVFGLGGADGAAAAHRRADQVGLERTLADLVPRLLAAGPPTGGLALVEDGAHCLTHVEWVEGECFLQRDRALLELARRLAPRLAIAHGHLLIVERMGKDLSGSGMDPHVLNDPDGRRRFGEIYVRALTGSSEGNGLGVGLATRISSRLLEAIDPVVTRLNAETSGSWSKIRVPPVYATDRAALAAAFSGASGPLLQISDTLCPHEALAAGYTPAQIEAAGAVVLERLGPMAFDPSGRLLRNLAGTEVSGGAAGR